jgi:hypothetical protein
MSDMVSTLLEASIEDGVVTQARAIWIGLNGTILHNDDLACQTEARITKDSGWPVVIFVWFSNWQTTNLKV